MKKKNIEGSIDINGAQSVRVVILVPIFAKFGSILDQFGPSIVFRTDCIYLHHMEENEVSHDIFIDKNLKVLVLVPILVKMALI